ncbi:MAG: hypothetical protein IKO48_04100 [Elusimicrobia bacterium]|nr:hypothetical protein [Elusimicrobiota bacterium]
MDKTNSKNTKWVVIGSIIFIVAILFAVGPFLVTKYMRAKWQDGPKYKVSNMLMNVSGELKISADKVYYLKGDNGLFYVLEDVKQDISEHNNEKCSVVGKFRQALNDETIDGNPVRLFIGVDRLVFKDSDLVLDNSEGNISDNSKADIDIKEKSLKKAQLRVEANARLNKKLLFDVVKGKVSSVKRVDNNNKEYTAFVLTDEFGDNYMLYKGGKDLSKLENNEIIVLGREIIPPSKYPLIVDETTFEIYEVYDINYNKLM